MRKNNNKIEDIVGSSLNLRQEKFCQLYATDKEFFGNGAESYLAVYDIDQNKPNWYQVACTNASRLLSNAKVVARINEILQQTGFNDAFVDRELSFLISQHADFQTKLGAIKEYNKLKQRIQDKLDMTTNGKELPTPILSYVSSDNRNNQDIEDVKKNQGGTGGNIGE